MVYTNRCGKAEKRRQTAMMPPIFLHDKNIIEAFLRREPYLHLYEMGDLDDFFWPYTTWVAGCAPSPAGGAVDVRALFLLYSGGGLPVLLAIAESGREELGRLLQASLHLLPRRFHSHLSTGLADILAAGGYSLQPHGRFLKMALTDPGCLDKVDTSQAAQLGPSDEGALMRLYEAAYPGNWFDPRMLQTGCYYGIWRAGEIVSVAGIHVYSPAYNAAALGNITTHPAFRGQGLGKAVIARLCQALRQQISAIGLNVRVSNGPAIAAYTRLGFTPVTEYEEYTVSV
jgi:ribosomal protein S18 acetylase RimI-like enzyme